MGSLTPAQSYGQVAIGDGLHLTESGNADRLVALHGDRFLWVPELDRFFAWDERRWRHDPGQALAVELAKDVARSIWQQVPMKQDHDQREQTLKWAKRSESSGNIQSSIRLTRGIPGILVHADELDVDPMLLNLQNGTLDLASGQLTAHQPDDRITKMTPVRFDEGATAPTWDGFIEQVLPETDRAPALETVIEELIPDAFHNMAQYRGHYELGAETHH